MNKGQSTISHNLRILDGIINEITTRFHIAKNEESPETDDHLSMLAGKIGYLVNISVGANKTWNFEERILSLEKEKNNPIPESVRKEYQFNPDIMLTIVRDNNGKLMN